MPTWFGECAALFPMGSIGVVFLLILLGVLLGVGAASEAAATRQRRLPLPPPPVRPASPPHSALRAHPGIVFGGRLAQALGIDPATVKKIVLTAEVGAHDVATAEVTQIFFDGDKVIEAVRTMRPMDSDEAVDPLSVGLGHFPHCARGEHAGDCFDKLGNRLWMGGPKDGSDRRHVTRRTHRWTSECDSTDVACSRGPHEVTLGGRYG